MLNNSLQMPNVFSNRLKEVIRLFFIGGGSLTVISATLSGGYTLSFFSKQIFLNGIAFVIFGLGNGLLADWIDKFLPWTKDITKRLVVSLLATIVFTSVAWAFIVWLWIAVLDGEIFGFSKLISVLPKNKNALVVTLMITFFVSAILHGRSFLVNWRQSLIEGEQLKKEQIAARYETLKNQVNPHFLFNSLNVLTTLVHKDADMAEQFVRQLSKVYRYVLESRDKEVVPLTEELTQLEAYIYLMKIRFGESLKTTINIQSEGMVAPLTLQMLLENALKHNEASKMHPLSIDMFQEGKDYIVVKNNVQMKTSVGESTGVGLENIRSRYQFLSDKKVLVHQDLDSFTVKIPIIQ